MGNQVVTPASFKPLHQKYVGLVDQFDGSKEKTDELLRTSAQLENIVGGLDAAIQKLVSELEEAYGDDDLDNLLNKLRQIGVKIQDAHGDIPVAPQGNLDQKEKELLIGAQEEPPKTLKNAKNLSWLFPPFFVSM